MSNLFKFLVLLSYYRKGHFFDCHWFTATGVFSGL